MHKELFSYTENIPAWEISLVCLVSLLLAELVFEQVPVDLQSLVPSVCKCLIICTYIQFFPVCPQTVLGKMIIVAMIEQYE